MVGQADSYPISSILRPLLSQLSPGFGPSAVEGLYIYGRSRFHCKASCEPIGLGTSFVRPASSASTAAVVSGQRWSRRENELRGYFRYRSSRLSSINSAISRPSFSSTRGSLLPCQQQPLRRNAFQHFPRVYRFRFLRKMAYS